MDESICLKTTRYRQARAKGNHEVEVKRGRLKPGRKLRQCNNTSPKRIVNKSLKMKSAERNQQKEVVNVSAAKREIIMSSNPGCSTSRQKMHEFECNFCDFVAETSFLLRTHIEIKHTNNQFYFPCSMCRYSFLGAFS